MQTMSIARAPAMFVQHGGGPLPLLNDPGHADLIKWMKTVGAKTLADSKPKAIVLVTAHWETNVPTISSSSTHELYYDYYGFPSEAYELKYPAGGHPQVAERVRQLLEKAGFQAKMDPKRGWDHGVFVPMLLLRPEADIPVVQLSVLSSQDPAEHYRYGKALEALRDENVAVVASGMSFHNMRELRSMFGSSAVGEAPNAQFEENLTHAMKSEEAVRREKFEKWETWAGARAAHPKGAAEHFMPAIVLAGAAGSSQLKVADTLKVLKVQLGTFVF